MGVTVCVKAPVTVDQVLLKGGGRFFVRLAWVRDVEGPSWLCQKSAHSKLGSSITYAVWDGRTRRGEQSSQSF